MGCQGIAANKTVFHLATLLVTSKISESLDLLKEI